MIDDKTRRAVAQALFLMGIDKIDQKIFGDPDKLADFIITGLSAHATEVTINKIDREDFQLTTTTSDGQKLQLLLSTSELRSEILAADANATSDLVSAFLGTCILLLDMERGNALDPELLVPLLKSSEFVADMETDRLSAGRAAKLVQTPVMDGVHTVIAANLPNGFVFVFESTARALGYDLEQLKENASRRLSGLAKKANYEIDWESGLGFVTGMDGLASSLLIVDAFWPSLFQTHGPKLFVHVADQDTLVLIRDGDRESLELLTAMILADRMPSLFPRLLFVRDMNGLREAKRSDFVRMN